MEAGSRESGILGKGDTIGKGRSRKVHSMYFLNQSLGSSSLHLLCEEMELQKRSS